MKINLTELSNEIYKELNIGNDHPTVSEEMILDMSTRLFELIKRHLCQGDSVFIWKFGTFLVDKSKPRKIHNIAKGEIEIIQPKLYPKLSFSKRFKRYINEK